ncbi:MAG: DUF2318 domain-containing protein [Nitrospirae bacterium]|nr:MAG: DUF2318 domain-containing protein [Nitrospirota bacterium]
MKAFIILLVLMFGACSERGGNSFTKVPDNDQSIVINVEQLSEKIPRFYEINAGNKKIELFVIKIDGQPGAYLNRCRKCFASGLGFSFEENSIRCKTCNESFPASEIPTGVGSCHPIRIKGVLNNGNFSVERKAVYSTYLNPSKS